MEEYVNIGTEQKPYHITKPTESQIEKATAVFKEIYKGYKDK